MFGLTALLPTLPGLTKARYAVSTVAHFFAVPIPLCGMFLVVLVCCGVVGCFYGYTNHRDIFDCSKSRLGSIAIVSAPVTLILLSLAGLCRVHCSCSKVHIGGNNYSWHFLHTILSCIQPPLHRTLILCCNF